MKIKDYIKVALHDAGARYGVRYSIKSQDHAANMSVVCGKDKIMDILFTTAEKKEYPNSYLCKWFSEGLCVATACPCCKSYGSEHCFNLYERNEIAGNNT